MSARERHVDPPLDVAALANRVSRLERSTRRWRLGALAATVALGASLFAGAIPHREEVAAEKFILRKTSDAGRAELSFDRDQMPQLLMQDRDGRTRLAVSLDVIGRPRVALRGKNEKRRAVLKLEGYDQPSFKYYDAAGKEIPHAAAAKTTGEAGGEEAAAAGSKGKTAMDERPKVAIETSMGRIVVELRRDKAPITVANFLKYTDEKFFDGTIFHRVISNFMIQGGGFDKSKNEKKTHAPIELEVNRGLSNLRGTIAMARTGMPDSATAQFFINVVDNEQLDSYGGGYAVFGKVVEGMEVVDKIKNTKTSNQGGAFQDCPVTTVEIIKVRRVDAE